MRLRLGLRLAICLSLRPTLRSYVASTFQVNVMSYIHSSCTYLCTKHFVWGVLWYCKRWPVFCFCTGKPHGLRTARKLRNHRRDQKWHDKDYKKSHLGTRWKSNPFGGASHAKGIVLEKVYVVYNKFDYWIHILKGWH